MLDPTVTERIRSIFLHDEPRVTLAGAARLLGRSHDDITAAIAGGDIETIATEAGPMIDAADLAEWVRGLPSERLEGGGVPFGRVPPEQFTVRPVLGFGPDRPANDLSDRVVGPLLN